MGSKHTPTPPTYFQGSGPKPPNDLRPYMLAYQRRLCDWNNRTFMTEELRNFYLRQGGYVSSVSVCLSVSLKK